MPEARHHRDGQESLDEHEKSVACARQAQRPAANQGRYCGVRHPRGISGHSVNAGAQLAVVGAIEEFRAYRAGEQAGDDNPRRRAFASGAQAERRSTVEVVMLDRNAESTRAVVKVDQEVSTESFNRRDGTLLVSETTKDDGRTTTGWRFGVYRPTGTLKRFPEFAASTARPGTNIRAELRLPQAFQGDCREKPVSAGVSRSVRGGHTTGLFCAACFDVRFAS